MVYTKHTTAPSLTHHTQLYSFLSHTVGGEDIRCSMTLCPDQTVQNNTMVAVSPPPKHNYVFPCNTHGLFPTSSNNISLCWLVSTPTNPLPESNTADRS